MTQKLSPRQREALDALQAFQRQNARPPTRAELGEFLGVSAQTADFHLKALERKGYLRLSRQSRGIDLLATSIPCAEEGISSTEAIPLLGRVAAGSPLMALENQEGRLPLPQGCAANFALRVQGDSMIEAGILDGDMVLVEQVADASTGEIVVALIGEGDAVEATVKRYLPQRDRVVLRPANAAMADLVIRRGEIFSIAGRVVGVLRIWG